MSLIQTDITLVDGSPARMCPHAAEAWPVLRKLAKAKGLGDLGLYQAYGFASASGGTHANGTALDVSTDSPDFALLAREAGWNASWPRGPAYHQNFVAHSHIVSRCACNPNAAKYQTSAVLAGYDGLGPTGRSGRDYAPRPAVWRDWQAGLDWAKAELVALQPKVEEEEVSMFLAFTADFDDTAPDGGAGKVCLVVPGKVVWLDPDSLGLWTRVLPDSMKQFRGSPFLWVQLQKMADQMAASNGGARGLSPQDAGFKGATLADIKELLS